MKVLGVTLPKEQKSICYVKKICSLKFGHELQKIKLWILLTEAIEEFGV